MNPRIVIDPDVQHGNPVIRGTRVPVATILANIAGRMTREEIAAEYGVTDDDISAALDYAIGLLEAQRPMRTDVHPRIAIDPNVQHGKAVIRGTRVPVARILGELANGMSREEITREYRVTLEDVAAAIEYAAERWTP